MVGARRSVLAIHEGDGREIHNLFKRWAGCIGKRLYGSSRQVTIQDCVGFGAHYRPRSAFFSDLPITEFSSPQRVLHPAKKPLAVVALLVLQRRELLQQLLLAAGEVR